MTADEIAKLIPGEAEKAAARAISADECPDDFFEVCYPGGVCTCRKHASAALAAGLAAWQTSMNRSIIGKGMDAVGTMYPAIILPLPQENTNAES